MAGLPGATYWYRKGYGAATEPELKLQILDHRATYREKNLDKAWLNLTNKMKSVKQISLLMFMFVILSLRQKAQSGCNSKNDCWKWMSLWVRKLKRITWSHAKRQTFWTSPFETFKCQTKCPSVFKNSFLVYGQWCSRPNVSNVQCWFMVSGVPDQMSQTFSVGLWSVYCGVPDQMFQKFSVGLWSVVFQTKCSKRLVLVYGQWCSRPNVSKVQCWFMVSGVPDQMSQTFSVGLWSVVQTKCLKMIMKTKRPKVPCVY